VVLRGIVRRPAMAVSRLSSSRLTVPAVKMAVNPSPASMARAENTFSQLGPSSMSGFGPTVTIVFVAE